MVTFLNDALTPDEWNRRRTLQVRDGDPNGGVAVNNLVRPLSDLMPMREWQQVRTQQASGAPRTASVAEPPDAKRAAAKDYGAHQLMDLVPTAEGTSSYDASYSNGDGSGKNYPQGWKKPTELTIDEAISMDPAMNRSAGNFAIGLYQFKKDALTDAKRRMNLTGAERLTPAMQDRIARDRLAYRGYDAYLSGALPVDEFRKSLALEWPSMAATAGVKQFDGVRFRDPRLSADVVRDALVRAQAEADRITNSYIEAGQLPPEGQRWREPPRKAAARRR